MRMHPTDSSAGSCKLLFVLAELGNGARHRQCSVARIDQPAAWDLVRGTLAIAGCPVGPFHGACAMCHKNMAKQLETFAIRTHFLTMFACGSASSSERTGVSSRPGSTPEQPGCIFLLPRATSYAAVAPLRPAREARPWANAPVPTISTCWEGKRQAHARSTVVK